jgi:hypothetical protein
MRERIVASNNPNFLFMNYSLKTMGVVDLFVVPKHFFVPEILEKRKPLADTARRAGWIGCNILLSQIPDSGKIFFVRNSQPVKKGHVLPQWKRTLFLRDETPTAKGWLLEVMKCVEMIGKRIRHRRCLCLRSKTERHLSKQSERQTENPAAASVSSRQRASRFCGSRHLSLAVARLKCCNIDAPVQRLRMREERMAWFRNFYVCADCDSVWTDEWSCMCDDDCPRCGGRHMSPYRSDDLTEIIEPRRGDFVVLWSPETAEDNPDYRELATFATQEQAEAFLRLG